MLSSITDLGPADVLAAAEDALRKRREAQVTDLLAVLQWADLHSGDPQDQPGAIPVKYGGDRLVQVGGPGTPQVAELCVHELAIARQTHPASTRATMADALDLRHRLPKTWGQVLELACEPWVAAKVARITRRLDHEACELVDLAVAEAIAGQSPGRVIAIAEAKTIEADTAAHTARLDAERRRRGVWVSRTDTQTGTRTVFSRIEPGDATWIDATLERIVAALVARPDILRAHHPDLPAALDDLTHDELRAIAFGWLARPDDIRELLDAAQTSADSETGVARKPHHAAVVHLHLHEAALTGGTGIVRAEELGPLLLEQVITLLGHAHVTINPVIDLDDHTRVNAYEVPTRVAQRVRLRCVGDTFPHATSTNTMTGRYDNDHPVPYDPGGPPGQTGDHNTAPLSRTNHRAKTHRGYQVRQIDDATYLWTTPHGLTRLVDPTGTHQITDTDAWVLAHPDFLTNALDRIENDLRNGPDG